jgi:hypothetical protein
MLDTSKIDWMFIRGAACYLSDGPGAEGQPKEAEILMQSTIEL